MMKPDFRVNLVNFADFKEFGKRKTAFRPAIQRLLLLESRASDGMLNL
jgi:hypothetical protein